MSNHKDGCKHGTWKDSSLVLTWSISLGSTSSFSGAFSVIGVMIPLSDDKVLHLDT